VSERNRWIGVDALNDDSETTGIQVALVNQASLILEADETVKFDTVIHQMGKGIRYYEESGEFMFAQPGDYKLHWQVATDGTQMLRFVTFGIKINGAAYHDFALPVTTGLLASDAIFSTTSPCTVVEFYNKTKDQVRLSRHSPNANLVITRM